MCEIGRRPSGALAAVGGEAPAAQLLVAPENEDASMSLAVTGTPPL
jgi:hypothetical protein